MKILMIESFNSGDILKIYLSDDTYYYYDAINKTRIDLSPSDVDNLISNSLKINCAVCC